MTSLGFESSSATTKVAEDRARVADPVPHLEYIDALRGLAILLVILAHCGYVAGLKHVGVEGILAHIGERGRYGVQLFYVISAFTLFQSMDARSRRDVHPLRAFFARRVFRIAPLFWASIIFYLCWFGLGPRPWSQDGITATHIALTATFLHGWHPDMINAVVFGGWSIAVEMMFYLTLPFLHRRFRSPGRIVALLALTLTFAFFSDQAGIPGRLYPVWRASNPDLIDGFGYFWLPNQFPVFVLGLLLYTLRRATTPGPGEAIVVERGPLVWSLAGLFLALAASSFDHFPKHILWAVAFCLVTWGLSVYPTRLLVNRLTCYLGKISFSAYLTHYAALVVAVRMLGMELRGDRSGAVVGDHFVPILVQAASWPGPVRLALILAITLPLTVVLSTATYRLIEEPGIRLGKWVIRRADW